MSKVAIVTIISKNYGNRLQNYALQEVLKQMGVDVETIPMRAGKQSIKSDLKYLIKTDFYNLRFCRRLFLWEVFGILSSPKAAFMN